LSIDSTHPLSLVRKPIVFDEGMLLIANSERLLAYNGTARRVWCTLADGGNAADAAQALAAAFPLDLDQARSDVAAIIDHWANEGLLAPECNRQPAKDPSEASPLPNAPRCWAEQWMCRFGGRLVEFRVENARRAAVFRLPFHALEVSSGHSHIDARLEIRELGNDAVAILRDGCERTRVYRDEGLKEAIHLAVIDLLWPAHPVSVVVHAAAVARGGMGMCFPAPSGSGKSTLIAHLLANGYEYLVDDLTALDERHRILPWPLPLSVKKGSWDLLAPVHPQLRSSPQFAAGDTRVRFLSRPDAWMTMPKPLSALIFPFYERSQRAALHRIRPLEALIHLCNAGIWLGHPLTEARVTPFLSTLEVLPSYALTYDRLSDATQLLDELHLG
jgi:hypothetical protein